MDVIILTGGGFQMIDLKFRTACFTGHRELPAKDLPEISKRLEDTLVTLIEQGYRYFGGRCLGVRHLGSAGCPPLAGALSADPVDSCAAMP